MDNNEIKKSNKPLVIILICVVLIAFCAVAFALVYPFVFENEDNEEHVSTVVSKVYTDSDKFIAHIEDVVGIDIPDELVTEREIFEYKISKYHNTVDYYAYLRFDNLSKEEIKGIDEQVAQDERFRTSLGDMKKILDINGGEVLDEYKLVYVMDTGEFNTLPDKAGEYRVITIYYDTDFHGFQIEEYNNYYYKTEYPTQ